MEYIELILKGVALLIISSAFVGLSIAGGLLAFVLFTRMDEKK